MNSEPTSSNDLLVRQAQELIAAGNFDDAEKMLLDLVKNNDPKNNVVCYEALSAFAESRGNTDDSIRYAMRALTLNKDLHGEESDQVVSSMERVAQLYENVERFEEANDLLYRAQIIKDRLVYSEAEPEPEVGSSETTDPYISETALRASKTQKEDESPEEKKADGKSKRKVSKEKDDESSKFVFADSEPRAQDASQHNVGWLVESINKPRKAPPEPPIHSINRSDLPKPTPKGEITGGHQFRFDELPANSEPNSFISKLSSRAKDNGSVKEPNQRESTTHAPKSRRDLEITDSGLKAVADTRDHLTRTLQMSNIRWTLKQWLKKKSSLYILGSLPPVIFLIVLVIAYMQPRKVDPLEVYLGMPHNYRSITGDTKIKLERQEAALVEQGDNKSTISTNYIVDWRSILDASLRSFFEREYWLTKSSNALISDEGHAFYTSSNFELLTGDELKSISEFANSYYLEHSSYPSKLPPYRNIHTRAVATPSLKRTDYIASDANDVVAKITQWQKELASPVNDAQAGAISCFELKISHPTGRMESFAVRSCKPDQQPQIIFSSDGEVVQQKTEPFIPFDGVQMRWRRIWIEPEARSSMQAFVLHHVSLVVMLLVSLAVAASYTFLRLSGQSRAIRSFALWISLILVCLYAASPFLP